MPGRWCAPTRLRAGAITAQAEGEDAGAALAGLGARHDRVIRIGEGQPAALPAPVLPDSGQGLAGFTQADPPDAIGAWVRLRLAGFRATHPHWDGVICAFDDGISHWIHLSANEAVSSQSFLTPRLIALLGGATEPEMAAVSDTLSRPERLAAHLRAAEVSGDAPALTGHLIGAEIAAARAYWLGQRVAVLDDTPAPLAAALAAQGVPCERHDPETLLAPGLGALGRALGLDG